MQFLDIGRKQEGNNNKFWINTLQPYHLVNQKVTSVEIARHADFLNCVWEAGHSQHYLSKIQLKCFSGCT